MPIGNTFGNIRKANEFLGTESVGCRDCYGVSARQRISSYDGAAQRLGCRGSRASCQARRYIAGVSGNEVVSSITAGSFAPVYVERLSIRAFRGVSECQIEFEPGVTVLAGHNNAGKSRILSALHLALGGRGADVDDFTVGLTQDPEIDLVLAPRPPETGDQEDAFDDAVGRRLGTGVQTIQEEPLRERFAWRTHVRRSATGTDPCDHPTW
jgi:hypothetical protein